MTTMFTNSHKMEAGLRYSKFFFQTGFSIHSIGKEVFNTAKINYIPNTCVKFW
jgi:hypothetical protein